MYGLRGLGDVTYDEDGMPVEDPSNTTYGATSGGTYPKPTTQTTATNWLNQNATTVAIMAAVGVGLLVFSKVGRR